METSQIRVAVNRRPFGLPRYAEGIIRGVRKNSSSELFTLV
jgi:hypothetical protein